MPRFAAAYIPALLVLLACDSLWLGLVALPMFRDTLGPLLTFRAVPGVLFYLLYAVGVVLLVGTITPRDTATVLWRGALLGLVAYGTYDLTNLATLRAYTARLAITDMAWGTTLTALASWVSARGGTWLGQLFHR